MNPEKCGDQRWVTEVIAPFGGAAAMVTDLKEKVFPDREIRMLVTAADGARSVRRM